MKLPIFFLLCLLVLVAITTADEPARRGDLTACINKEMEIENAYFKLQPEDLEKFKKIVDKEFMKEPLKKHSMNDHMKILSEIEKSAQRELPSVSTDTVEKMMNKMAEMAIHCCKDLGP